MKLRTLGNALIIFSLILLLLIYSPILIKEIAYLKNKLLGIQYTFESPETINPRIRVIQPVSPDFSLVVPKIGINAKVFANVDANNPKEYRLLLTKGVAHAKGSVLPGKEGYIFIFAHSADTPLNITRYNAIFYLLGKLEKGNEIDLFYQEKRYQYEVVEKKIVSAEEALSYFKKESSEKKLVLQTCYPPGTTLRRLIVVAKELN